MANDTIDTAFDGATVYCRLGATKVAGNKLEYGDSIKVEKVKRFGQQGPGARTLGSYELKDGKLTIETGILRRILMPKLPANGITLFEFPITAQQRHPSLGTYSVILDRVRLIGIEESLEASEKAAMVDVALDYMQIFRRGADGVWKSLNIIPTQPSPQAAQFML